ncbi:hypothetical protein IMZ48_32680 [Candidatus Bathyarchaeota archaeon]|nr:hypothetical protein [Candidatus Bathyarchaeota archaeon]
MKLLAVALFALMAVAEAKPVAEEKKVSIPMRIQLPKVTFKDHHIPGTLGGDCTDIQLTHERTGDGERDNLYFIDATCGGESKNHAPTTSRVNLDDCVKNDDGTLYFVAKGEGYLPPPPIISRACLFSVTTLTHLTYSGDLHNTCKGCKITWGEKDRGFLQCDCSTHKRKWRFTEKNDDINLSEC